jgi:hypothetical protein
LVSDHIHAQTRLGLKIDYKLITIEQFNQISAK